MGLPMVVCENQPWDTALFGLKTLSKNHPLVTWQPLLVPGHGVVVVHFVSTTIISLLYCLMTSCHNLLSFCCDETEDLTAQTFYQYHPQSITLCPLLLLVSRIFLCGTFPRFAQESHQNLHSVLTM